MDDFYECIIDHVMRRSSVLLLITDMEGTILDANMFAEKISGKDLKGKKISEIMVNFSGDFSIAEYAGRGSERLLMNIVTSSGLPESFYFNFFDKNGRVLVIGEMDYAEVVMLRKNMVGLNNDLSNLTRELQKSNTELEKLNAVKNRFLGMAAHDLRSPLGIIESYSDFLLEELEGRLDEDHSEFLSIIKSTSAFMRGLIENLLDLAMIEQGKLELDPEVLDPLKLIERNIYLNSTLAARKKISIELIAPQSLPSACIDENKILQVLNNLISNAVKFSPEGSAVKVYASSEGGFLSVSVSDQGPGIPENEQEKLFRPFSRTSVKPTAGEKSTGLGLAIVQSIIRAHNGDITLESRPGKGSVFTFKVPVNTY